MSDHVSLKVPEDLLRRWIVEKRRAGASEADQLLMELADAGLEALATEQSSRREREEAAIQTLLPLLEEAAARAVYVRTAYVDRSKLDDTEPFVAGPPNNGIVPSISAWSRHGYRVQMVVKSGHGGYTVEGYRLAPDGDARSGIELSEVYAQAGRCTVCGISRQDQAASDKPCHTFHDNHSWPDSAPEATTSAATASHAP